MLLNLKLIAIIYLRSNNMIGLAPAIYLQLVNETNINSTDKVTIPAFELFSSSWSINEDYSGTKNVKANENIPTNTNKLSEIPSWGASNVVDYDKIQQQTSDFDSFQEEHNADIYYAIEDYTDEVGDGVNLKKGKKVAVI